jgi:4-hydroxy-3-methylbut-2-en-1-yl diphosphate reductase
MKIVKARELGFCYGVRRAIDMLEKSAASFGSLDTLGPVVHNEQVTQKLNDLGIHVRKHIDDIVNPVVAISSHGSSPEIEISLRQKSQKVIDTTCPFVRRAQITARRLSEAGFFVIIYGESGHPEVKGILGHAKDKGMATLDYKNVAEIIPSPRRLGILSQTTQIPECFNQFVKNIIDISLKKDVEIRIMDTICHDIRKRQEVSLDLATKVDMMLVIGGQLSANTRRLFEICSSQIETHLIEKAEEIKIEWLENKNIVGIASGTSTPDYSINEIVDKLKCYSF